MKSRVTDKQFEEILKSEQKADLFISGLLDEYGLILVTGDLEIIYLEFEHLVKCLEDVVDRINLNKETLFRIIDYGNAIQIGGIEIWQSIQARCSE